MIKSQTVTVPNTASTTTVHAVAGLVGLDALDTILVVATLTGLTGGVLDTWIQVSESGAATSTWVDYAAFPQVLAAAAATSYAFTASRFGEQLAIYTVGVGSVPVLATGIVLGGEFGERMRIITRTGVGVSAGADQVVRVIGSPAKRRV